MADTKQAEAEDIVLLATSVRWATALFGLTLLAVGVFAVIGCFPTMYEWDEHGSMVKSIRAVSDLSGIVTALTISGVALIAYALNGVRLLKFGAGSVVAEGSSAVQRFKAHPPSEAEAKTVSPPKADEVEEQEVEPTRNPAAVLNEDMAVFELSDVPSRVIGDALTNWPSVAGDRPSNLAQFEYASRRQGQGPHPWILKFRDRPEVRVFYGGRGKRDATVRRTDD
jgi:hypothetical protein